MPPLPNPAADCYMEVCYGSGGVKAHGIGAEQALVALDAAVLVHGRIRPDPHDGLRIYGSASSLKGESIHCLESPAPNRIGFGHAAHHAHALPHRHLPEDLLRHRQLELTRRGRTSRRIYAELALPGSILAGATSWTPDDVVQRGTGEGWTQTATFSALLVLLQGNYADGSIMNSSSAAPPSTIRVDRANGVKRCERMSSHFTATKAVTRKRRTSRARSKTRGRPFHALNTCSQAAANIVGTPTRKANWSPLRGCWRRRALPRRSLAPNATCLEDVATTWASLTRIATRQVTLRSGCFAAKYSAASIHTRRRR